LTRALVVFRSNPISANAPQTLRHCRGQGYRRSMTSRKEAHRGSWEAVYGNFQR
jgi:hypothetical protein